MLRVSCVPHTPIPNSITDNLMELAELADAVYHLMNLSLVCIVLQHNKIPSRCN